LRRRKLEKPAILRVSGSFGFFAAPDLGFVRCPRRSGSFGFPDPWSDRPRLDARLGILPHFRRRDHRDLGHAVTDGTMC
jgi:hypothetical protein